FDSSTPSISSRMSSTCWVRTCPAAATGGSGPGSPGSSRRVTRRCSCCAMTYSLRLRTILCRVRPGWSLQVAHQVGGRGRGVEHGSDQLPGPAERVVHRHTDEVVVARDVEHHRL